MGKSNNGAKRELLGSENSDWTPGSKKDKDSTVLSEKALRASELRYRRLFEAAKDGVLILEGNTGRINEVNPFLFNLLGLSPGEMIGKTMDELSPFEEIESNRIMLERLKKDRCVRYDELPVNTISGRKIVVEIVSNMYQEGDRNVIQCNIRDITERKHAQDEIRLLKETFEERVLERTAELKIVNDELETFSYSVSHDLRAPLRQVLGFIKILQEEAETSLSEKSLTLLATISRSGKRMGKIIDDLLAFAHVGRAKLKKAEVNLAELVRETAGDFQADTTARKIVWNIQPLPTVEADRALLRMALVNLLSNAVKFTSGRANPTIEIGHAPDASSETVIFIRDNGAGFNPEYAHKLFGAFQRLHSQSQFEGTGIGLANVQRIIHRHGGRTWAEGVVNGGAIFYFSIPKIHRSP